MASLLKPAEPKADQLFWVFVKGAIILSAFLFVWVVGHRGLMILDQSALFDSAWRSYQGQVLYRDYYLPRPPIVILIQWFFFHLSGVGFSSMVLPAALLNAGATASVMWLVSWYFPRQRLVACTAGLLTAVWFQAPFGTLWFEQTAFFFNLIAVVLLVAAFQATPSISRLMQWGAGLASGLAILSKQNAGIEFLPVLFLVLFFQNRGDKRSFWRGSLFVGTGLMAVVLALAIWLLTISSFEGFWYCLVNLPIEIAQDRIGLAPTFLGLLMLAATPQLIPYLGILGLAAWNLRSVESTDPKARVALWLGFGLLYYEDLFQLHTQNEAINGLPYMGLIFGLGMGALVSAMSATRQAGDGNESRWRLLTYSCVGGLIVMLTVGDGIGISWRRIVQQFDSQTQFIPLSLPRAQGLLWGEPTPVSDDPSAPVFVSGKDFQALNDWLENADENFFVFPDTTILYGLHGRVSPQPWVAFIRRHTFLDGELPHVDSTVVESLRKNDVQAIILEQASWLGNNRLIDEMPHLRSMINDHFEKVAEFGIYQVWQSRERITSGGPE